MNPGKETLYSLEKVRKAGLTWRCSNPKHKGRVLWDNHGRCIKCEKRGENWSLYKVKS